MLDDVKKILTVALLVVLMFTAGCSEEVSIGGPTAASSEPTPGASASPTIGPETTMQTGTLESGLGEASEVVLRVEGDSGVTFSGLCNVGSEGIVLGGRSVPVPKRYDFATRGRRLSCRIQKRDPSDGDLKVTLLAGGGTHSVQQINTPGSAINVSYDGG